MTAPKQIAGELAAGGVADIVRRTGVRMLLRVDAGDLGIWTAR